MPIGIEDLVRLKQSCDACAGRTGEELQERREVFGADALGGQRRVAQTVLVWRGQPREVACRREGARRGGCVECVHVAERRAEQACERVLKGFPPLVDASQSSLVSQVATNEGRSMKKPRWHLPCLPLRPVAHPRPQLRSGANSGFTRVSPPIVVPFPRVDRQMEFGNCVLAQDLAESQRKDAIVLRWEKARTNAHGQPGEDPVK